MDDGMAEVAKLRANVRLVLRADLDKALKQIRPDAAKLGVDIDAATGESSGIAAALEEGLFELAGGNKIFSTSEYGQKAQLLGKSFARSPGKFPDMWIAWQLKSGKLEPAELTTTKSLRELSELKETPRDIYR